MEKNNSIQRLTILKGISKFIACLILILPLSNYIQANQEKIINEKFLLSEQSQNMLREFFAKNLLYPEIAKKNNITGEFIIIVKIGKGGKIESLAAKTNYDKNKVPPIVLDVITLNNSDLQGDSLINERLESITNRSKIIEDEAIRVTRMIEALKLPELQANDSNFSIRFNFKSK